MQDVLFILIPVVALVWLLKGSRRMQDTNTTTTTEVHNGFSITRKEYNEDLRLAFLKGLDMGMQIKGQGLDVVQDKGQLLVGTWYRGKFANTHTLSMKGGLKAVYRGKKPRQQPPTPDYPEEQYVQ